MRRIAGRSLHRSVVAGVRGLLDLPTEAEMMVRHACGLEPAVTVHGVQQRMELGRRGMEELATSLGIEPPMRLLRTIKVAAAWVLLHRGISVSQAAKRLGYGKTDTLRQHCHTVVGGPPSLL